MSGRAKTPLVVKRVHVGSVACGADLGAGRVAIQGVTDDGRPVYLSMSPRQVRALAKTLAETCERSWFRSLEVAADDAAEDGR